MLDTPVVDKAKKRVILLHGILSTGYLDLGKFREPLTCAGFQIDDLGCPFEDALEVWFIPRADHERAKTFAETLALRAVQGQQPPHVIAHSNGCRFASLAMEYGACFDKVFFFAPAWRDDQPYPLRAFNKLHVIYSKFDFAINLGGVLPFCEFGFMGRNGYRGPRNEHIVNVNAGIEGIGHVTYFKYPLFDKWLKYVLDNLE